ncbi:MAG TPA: DUF5654 family protein [Candidatus Norongarragalinales archaeon]|nr:DUF5654 family protein [Candidatus Norongarragalinales archaeon]
MAVNREELQSRLMGKKEQRIIEMFREQKRVQKEIWEKMALMITSALGLVAALAWNEAIQAAFRQYLSTTDALMGKFLYALIVTALAVTIAYYVGKLFGNANEPPKSAMG